MRPIDDETVPVLVTPELLVILTGHLPITELPIGVLVHRRLDHDRRSVAEPRIVPARPLEIEPALLDHSFWCAEIGIENLNTLTGRDLHAYRVWRREGTVKAARKFH